MDAQEAPPAPELLLHPGKGQVTVWQCWQPPLSPLEQRPELPVPVPVPRQRHWEGNVWPPPLHPGLLQLPLAMGGPGCVQIQQQ